MTVMAADTPNAIQPATPALQVIEATTRNAAASRKRLSRMNRELSLIMLRTSIALLFAQHLPSYRRGLFFSWGGPFSFLLPRPGYTPPRLGNTPPPNTARSQFVTRRPEPAPLDRWP